MIPGLNDFQELSNLTNLIREGRASSMQMNRFLKLVRSSSQNNDVVLMNYLSQAGYYSINEFLQDYEKIRNKEVSQGLAVIGTAVLIGYLLSKK